MKILHLTLKKKWFDMIASGEKKEEYRDIKPYWEKRLGKWIARQDYTHVMFRNGYAKDSPKMTVECNGIKFQKGEKKWGAEDGVIYYVILLGKIINPPTKTK